MKKFVFIYYSGENGNNPNEMSMDDIMADWGKWYEKLGSKIVDGGAPFNDDGKTVSAKSIDPISEWPASGYTIVSAEDMAEACELAKSNPMHEHTNGSAEVRIYEAMPM